MYLRILIVFFVLFLYLCLIRKDELIQNIFFTVMFIVSLWLNVPCFYPLNDISALSGNPLFFPFKLNNVYGIFYTVIANILVCLILYFQYKFTNENTYKYESVKKKYDEFVMDANELYIIGRDLDFLGKPEFEQQKNQIMHLGNNCKLMCEMTTNIKLLNLYKKVCKEGIEIKFYSKDDSITNLKGQIKIDQIGNKKAIFMSKVGKKYLLLYIDNQFLVAFILARYQEIYKKATLV